MGPVVYILGQNNVSESIIKAYGEHGNSKKYPYFYLHF